MKNENELSKNKINDLNENLIVSYKLLKLSLKKNSTLL